MSSADDVTQSLRLRVQRIADVPPITNPRAYLYRLAANLAIDHLKGEMRRLQVDVEAQALLWGSDEALAADRVVIASDALACVEAAGRREKSPASEPGHPHPSYNGGVKLRYRAGGPDDD